jgi:hypothetical protein
MQLLVALQVAKKRATDLKIEPCPPVLRRCAIAITEGLLPRRLKEMEMEMTPVLLIAGVLVLVSLGLVGLYVFGHMDGAPRRLHIRITLWPPSFDFSIEQGSD